MGVLSVKQFLFKQQKIMICQPNSAGRKEKRGAGKACGEEAFFFPDFFVTFCGNDKK